MQAITPIPEPSTNLRALESLRRAQRLIAIDPGTYESAWIVYDHAERRPIEWATDDNHHIRKHLPALAQDHNAEDLVIEGMQSFGMPVGQETFDTLVEIGRFIEKWWARKGKMPLIVYRKDIVRHLCGNSKGGDTNVRQALINQWGTKDQAIGNIRARGPLYGITGHAWSSLAVAVYASEMMNLTGRPSGKSEDHSV